MTDPDATPMKACSLEVTGSDLTIKLPTLPRLIEFGKKHPLTRNRRDWYLFWILPEPNAIAISPVVLIYIARGNGQPRVCVILYLARALGELSCDMYGNRVCT